MRDVAKADGRARRGEGGAQISGGPITELIDGYGAAAACAPFWAGLFFYLFYVVGVVAVFNVVAAFIIDAFLARYEADQADGQHDETAEEMHSLHAAQVCEAGWEVVARTRARRDVLFKSMFADELARILKGEDPDE